MSKSTRNRSGNQNTGLSPKFTTLLALFGYILVYIIENIWIILAIVFVLLLLSLIIINKKDNDNTDKHN